MRIDGDRLAEDLPPLTLRGLTPADPVADEMRVHAVAAVTAPTGNSEDFDATDVLTLAALTEQYGAATPEEVDLFLEGADLVKLAADGADVSTRRITREGARIWGIISGFLDRATPAQRALVPAITNNFLRVVIWSTYHGQELYASRRGVQNDVPTVRVGRTADSADLLACADDTVAHLPSAGGASERMSADGVVEADDTGLRTRLLRQRPPPAPR